MKGMPKWVIVWGGVAVVFLAPSLGILGFYVAAQTCLAASPLLEAVLADASNALRAGLLVCSRERFVQHRLTPREIHHLDGAISDAVSRFRWVGGAWNEDAVEWFREHPLDVTRGIRDLYDAQVHLGDFMSSRYSAFEEYCNMSEWPDPHREELGAAARAQAEREGEKKMREHATQLEQIQQVFVTARAEHEKRKVLFNIIAWSDFLFEAGGICCVVLGVRSVWKRRRAAAKRQGAQP